MSIHPSASLSARRGASSRIEREALLTTLRAKMAACAGHPAAGRDCISLGHPALDAAFPQGGLACGALHAAAPAAYADQPSALGLLAGLAARTLASRPGAVIWIRSPAVFDFGAPYAPGLAGLGLDAARLVQVRAGSAKDALWSAEEALRSPGAAAVVLECGRGLDAVCARRLQLAAEAGGALGLIFGGAVSVARTRWTVAAGASAAPDWARGQGLPAILVPPGSPCWRVQIHLPQGREISLHLEWSHEAHGFRPAAVLADGSLATAAA